MKSELINMIIETQGVDENVAETKLEAVISAIRKKDTYKDFEEDELYKIALSAMRAKYKQSSSEGESYTGMVIGIGATRDNNRKLFDEALKLKQDEALESGYIALFEDVVDISREEALKKGIISKKDQKYVVIDTRAELGKGEKKFENGNFGKPLKHEYVRNVYMIIDDVLETVSQKKIETVKIGSDYSFIGKRANNNVIYGDTFRFEGSYDATDMWNLMFDFQDYLENVLDIVDVHEVSGYELILTGGIVEKVFETGNGSVGLIIYSDAEITCWVNTPELKELALNLTPGVEVFMFGNASADNKSGGNKFNVYGIYTNPRMAEQGRLAAEFDELL